MPSSYFSKFPQHRPISREDLELIKSSLPEMRYDQGWSEYNHLAWCTWYGEDFNFSIWFGPPSDSLEFRLLYCTPTWEVIGELRNTL